MTAECKTEIHLTEKCERNYGLDLLRVVSAFMIVMLHVMSQGGFLKAMGNLTIGGEILWFLQIGCVCFVNVFALISGFVGLGSKQKMSSIVGLWLQVTLYGLISKVIIMTAFGEPFSFSTLLKGFFPVITSENWYFTAYFALFFFMPVLNDFVNKAETKTIRRCLLVSIILFMFAESLRSVEEFGIQAGYSVLWLALMYVIGAYIKKYDPFRRLGVKKCLLGFFACMLVTFLSRICLELVTWKLYGTPSYGTKFITYTSPIMVLQAIFILQCFSTIKLSAVAVKIVSFFAPMTFGVFVLHTVKAFYRYTLYQAFLFVEDYSLPLVLLIMIGTTFTIWLACNLIDYIRIFLFKCFRIGKLSAWIGKKIEQVFDKLG